MLLDLRHIGEEYIETLLLCQDSGTYATLSTA